MESAEVLFCSLRELLGRASGWTRTCAVEPETAIGGESITGP